MTSTTSVEQFVQIQNGDDRAGDLRQCRQLFGSPARAAQQAPAWRYPPPPGWPGFAVARDGRAYMIGLVALHREQPRPHRHHQAARRWRIGADRWILIAGLAGRCSQSRSKSPTSKRFSCFAQPADDSLGGGRVKNSWAATARLAGSKRRASSRSSKKRRIWMRPGGSSSRICSGSGPGCLSPSVRARARCLAGRLKFDQLITRRGLRRDRWIHDSTSYLIISKRLPSGPKSYRTTSITLRMK